MSDHATPHVSILVCTAPLVQRLNEARLPPNYVGVRRVRLSKQAYAAGTVTSSDVTFKITNPDGSERRMNRQEKKALKKKLALEKKLTKKKAKESKAAEGNGTCSHDWIPENSAERESGKRTAEEADVDFADIQTSESEEQESNSNIKSSPVISIPQHAPGDKYHLLSINATTLEQEMSELRGDRKGLPPVLLSPPMAAQARAILGASSPCFGAPSMNSTEGIARDASSKRPSSCWIQYDPKLSEEWARALTGSMEPANRVRQSEDMRTMAYQLTPEPWTRLRPLNPSNEPFPSEAITVTSSDIRQHRGGNLAALEPPAAKEWIEVMCRPPASCSTWFDRTSTAVFEYLHRETNCHVSCGAKFGSDLLLYDGPRDERHAFAGLRILAAPQNSASPEQPTGDETGDTSRLPLPSAYSLAGYVRCLNTAGKLALLATVVEESLHNSNAGSAEGPKTLLRVALIDVALEKILSAPSHQRYSRTEKRRDVTQNLAKPIKQAK